MQTDLGEVKYGLWTGIAWFKARPSEEFISIT
jgi:hypothetical protein